MRPELIVTDELYGENDAAAVKFARDCDIAVVASSHVCDRDYLRSLPFDFFIKLNGINLEPEIYDKDFNTVCNNSAYDSCGGAALGRKEKEGGGIRRTV